MLLNLPQPKAQSTTETCDEKQTVINTDQDQTEQKNKPQKGWHYW
jgi:hypothetical protein